MLEGLMQGLALWLYGLILEIVEYVADSLLQVFNMDLDFFESNVPVTGEIVNIILAAGWAILLGNLVFQASKSMMSGIGFEGEDPKILFCRTFVFAFLLLAGRQICEIGLGLTSTINTLLQTPDSVQMNMPPLDTFAIPSSWLLVLIIGIVMMFQVVKFFFEIAERYVVLVVLTILAPLAFGVGGSKNTEDIFKGWARIFGSACLMMIMNTVFLKLLLSALSSMPTGSGLFPWFLLVVAIARVARKIDDIVARIGLNTARTGDPIGRGGIMYPIMVAKQLGSIVSKTAGAGKTSQRPPSTGRQHGGSTPHSPPPPSPSPASGSGGSGSQPQEKSGSAAPSGSAPQTGSASTPSGHTPSGVGVTAPPMSTPAGDSGHNKQTPPSRPPVGMGRDGVPPAVGRNRSNTTAANTMHKPPLSANSVAPCNIGSDTGQPQTGQPGSESPVTGSRQQGRPPLSVDSQIPGMAGRKASPSGSNPAYPALTGSENKPMHRTPRKPVNVDIFRDDAPASTSGRKPTATPRCVPPVQSDTRHAAGSQSHSNTQTSVQSSATRNSTVTGTNVPSSHAAGVGETKMPNGAASPGAGRMGGLNPAGSPKRSGGITVPGSSHRPPSRNAATPRTAGSESANLSSQSSAAPSSSSRPGRASTHGESRREAHRPAHTPAGVQHPVPSTKPARYRKVEQNYPKQADRENINLLGGEIRILPVEATDHPRHTILKTIPNRQAEVAGHEQ